MQRVSMAPVTMCLMLDAPLLLPSVLWSMTDPSPPLVASTTVVTAV